MVKIDLKGQIKEFEQGVTAADVAKSIGMGLYKSACAAKIDGQACDLRTPIERDCSLEILTFDSEEGKHAYWHTTSHIMAQAVMRLYPRHQVLHWARPFENGFYYDFDLEQPLSTEDLPAIEEEMKKIIKENLPWSASSCPRRRRKSLWRTSLQGGAHCGACRQGREHQLLQTGGFHRPVRRPHLMSTGMVKAVKLTAITGAYWRGDAKNKMLTRVYGIAFPKQSMLEEHLQMLEEAKKRDHRRLGKELGLFMLRDEGPGFPFFLPKGMVLKNLLIDYWREVHKKYGYVEVSTPIILSRKLWERSGHWDHYKDNMYTTVIDEEDYAIKPMNCPGGMMVYQSQPHSYRDLPLRVGELGLVHRHELSGALHGLFRVRCFTQDDAHLFMTPDQLKDELKNVVRLFDEVYSVFGLSYKIELSTMPEDHIGTVEQWEHNQEILKEAITEMGKEYEVNEGDGAFYGPKLDFHLADSLGRTWQCGTVQLDSQLPERFELEYVGEDGQKHRPVMLHRVVLGSIERFIGVITEHFAGKFPLWLSPVQAVVLPISERHHEYAQKLQKELEEAGFRVECDLRNEKIGYKIREARLQRTPYMLVVGDQEAESGTISVRHRADGDLGSMGLESFVEKMRQEVASKEIK